MRGWLALLAFAVASPAFAATPPRPAWVGVWQGTIGTLPVRACFFQKSAAGTVGSYYYLSKMAAIALHREADGSWIEHGSGGAQVTGRWTVQPAGPRLAGDWRQGARRLAVTLTRVPSNLAEGGACGSTEYIAPRIRPVVLRTSPKRLGTFAYTEVKYDVGPNFSGVRISTFSYPSTQPGDRAINAALQVENEPEADYLSCMQGALQTLGIDGFFDFGLEPVLVKPEFLSVRLASDAWCGQPSPNTYSFQRLYDRKNGKRIDLSTWFTRTSVVPQPAYGYSHSHQLTPAFRALVLRHRTELRSDCADVVETSNYWDIALTHIGMEFWPDLPRVAMACGETISVPYTEFASRLSPAGKAGWARIAK